MDAADRRALDVHRVRLDGRSIRRSPLSVRERDAAFKSVGRVAAQRPSCTRAKGKMGLVLRGPSAHFIYASDSCSVPVSTVSSLNSTVTSTWPILRRIVLSVRRPYSSPSRLALATRSRLVRRRSLREDDAAIVADANKIGIATFPSFT
eukprot:scaffold10789_cov141-Isochrysis_galbana.AAC.7